MGKHQGINELKLKKNLQSVAEARAGRRFANLRVLNSYWVNQDAVMKYYEVILVDESHNPIHKHRECRGITSAGRKSRGLRKKGHRAIKIQGGSSYASWKRRNCSRFSHKR